MLHIRIAQPQLLQEEKLHLTTAIKCRGVKELTKHVGAFGTIAQALHVDRRQRDGHALRLSAAARVSAGAPCSFFELIQVSGLISVISCTYDRRTIRAGITYSPGGRTTL
jgi:hypothetical protein